MYNGRLWLFWGAVVDWSGPGVFERVEEKGVGSLLNEEE